MLYLPPLTVNVCVVHQLEHVAMFYFTVHFTTMYVSQSPHVTPSPNI